jgi:hypothetical protein
MRRPDACDCGRDGSPAMGGGMYAVADPLWWMWLPRCRRYVCNRCRPGHDGDVWNGTSRASYDAKCNWCLRATGYNMSEHHRL